MSAFGHPFTESAIQGLAQRPNADPNRILTGKGFSYPQRDWRYHAAAACFGPGGSVEAMWKILESEIARGQGATPWKIGEAARVRSHLTKLVAMDRDRSATFVRSLYLDRPLPVIWRGHEIAVRLGLEFKDGTGFFMRMLWTERRLAPGQKGLILVAAVVLAVTEASGLPRYERIEAWHLGAGEIAKYPARDLRTTFPRLDHLLSSAEGRSRQPPAA